MTLAEVAARRRADVAANPRDRPFPKGWNEGALYVVAEFEADPDFDLRARIEKLAGEWESDCWCFHPTAPSPAPHYTRFARRLRELVGEGKP